MLYPYQGSVNEQRCPWAVWLAHRPKKSSPRAMQVGTEELHEQRGPATAAPLQETRRCLRARGKRRPHHLKKRKLRAMVAAEPIRVQRSLLEPPYLIRQ